MYLCSEKETASHYGIKYLNEMIEELKKYPP